MSTLLASPRLAFLKKDSYMTRLAIVFLLLLIFFAAVRPGPFFAVRTWQSMAVQFPEFGLMSLGVMFTMFTAGIDLSVVAIANVTGICAALTLRSTLTGASATSSFGLAVLIALGVALVVGIVCGLINGILVAILKIPPILATLGTLELFGGVALVLTENILMLGTNETAARFSGLKVTSLLIRTYVFSGVMGAMAGLVMLANYNSAKADYGASYTLLTVLIVVLGGVNPNGGSGRLSGVLLSILTLQVLSSGLNMFPNISNFYRPLIWGGVLLLVICMNEGLFSFASLRTLLKGRSHADS